MFFEQVDEKNGFFDKNRGEVSYIKKKEKIAKVPPDLASLL